MSLGRATAKWNERGPRLLPPPAALLVFLAAAAGAGIVSADAGAGVSHCPIAINDFAGAGDRFIDERLLPQKLPGPQQGRVLQGIIVEFAGEFFVVELVVERIVVIVVE